MADSDTPRQKLSTQSQRPDSDFPDRQRISTSHSERQNLTMRMCIRRLTRLTNAFSRKWENLKAARALHFAYYNFCRVHSALRITPAIESGLTDHVWSIGELLEATHNQDTTECRMTYDVDDIKGIQEELHCGL